MAKVEYGSTLLTSTGNNIIVLNDSSLAVSRIAYWATFSDGTSAAGYYDSSVTFTGSSTYADENLTKSMTHYRNISGVKTKVFEFTTTLLDTGEFTINVSTLSANTMLRFIAYGS